MRWKDRGWWPKRKMLESDILWVFCVVISEDKVRLGPWEWVAEEMRRSKN